MVAYHPSGLAQSIMAVMLMGYLEAGRVRFPEIKTSTKNGAEDFSAALEGSNFL